MFGPRAADLEMWSILKWEENYALRWSSFLRKKSYKGLLSGTKVVFFGLTL